MELDALASLVAARRRGSPPADAELCLHAAQCSARRPCSFPRCDQLRPSVEHFRQCAAPGCARCAQARLVEADAAEDQFEALAKCRADVAGAEAEIKALMQNRTAVPAEAFKAESAQRREAWQSAKARLDKACERVHDLWRDAQKQAERGQRHGTPPQPVAQTPPKDYSPAEPGSHVAKKRVERQSASALPLKRDVLTSLTKARTSMASAEDKALFLHVSTCVEPRPCKKEPLCDEGKERMEHFRLCTTPTCGLCSMARLLEAKEANRPVTHLQVPLVRARTQYERAFEASKASVSAYFAGRKSSDLEVIKKLHENMSLAKKAQETAKKEYSDLCGKVYEEWKASQTIKARTLSSSSGEQEFTNMEDSGVSGPDHQEPTQTAAPHEDLHVSDAKTPKLCDKPAAPIVVNTHETNDLGKAAGQSGNVEPGVTRSEARPMPEPSRPISPEPHKTPYSIEDILEAFARWEAGKALDGDAVLIEHVESCASSEQPSHKCEEARLHFRRCEEPACVRCAKARSITLAARDKSSANLVASYRRAKEELDAAISAFNYCVGSGTPGQPLTALTENILKAQGALEFMAREIFTALRLVQDKAQAKATTASPPPIAAAFQPPSVGPVPLLPPSPLVKAMGSMFPTLLSSRDAMKALETEIHRGSIGSKQPGKPSTLVSDDRENSKKRARPASDDEIWAASPRNEVDPASIPGPSPSPSVATEAVLANSVLIRRIESLASTGKRPEGSQPSLSLGSDASGDRMARRMRSSFSETLNEDGVIDQAGLSSGFADPTEAADNNGDLRSASALSVDGDLIRRSSSGFSELSRNISGGTEGPAQLDPAAEEGKERPFKPPATELDFCTSLVVAAKTGEGEFAELVGHVTRCAAARPCAYPQCDKAKAKLEHFKQCRLKSCNPCAQARLISMPERDAEALFETLALSRKKEEDASASVKAARAQGPGALVEARRHYAQAKSDLDSVCAKIFELWQQKDG